MEIRRFEQHDTETCVEIWYEASILAHDFISKEVWESHKADLRNTYLQISETWVAEEEDQVVGFISLMDHYIGGLFVAPEKQGRGAGTQLIQQAKKEKEHLTVGVYRKNAQGRSFYRKNGFIEVDEELQPETGEIVINMSYKMLGD